MSTSWVIIIASISIYASSIAIAVEDKSLITKSYYLGTSEVESLRKAARSSIRNSGFKEKKAISRSAGVYFDTPEFGLLDKGSYLRFDAQEYRAKKNKMKFHELVQYSSKNYPDYPLGVKHYKSVKSFEGKHPLLGLVKRKERGAFLEALEKDGFDKPLRLKEIAKLSRVSNLYQMSIGDIDYGAVVIHAVRAMAFDREIEFNVLELQLNSSQNSDKRLIGFVERLSQELGLKAEDAFENEYALVHSQLNKNILLFNWIFQFPFIVTLSYVLTWGLVGFVIVWLGFRIRNS